MAPSITNGAVISASSQAAHEGNRFPSSMRRIVSTSRSPREHGRAAAPSRCWWRSRRWNTSRAGQCLGRASSGGGRGPRPRASAPPRTEFFFEADVAPGEEPPHRAAKVSAILRLRIATTISSSVRSDLIRQSAPAEIFACFSSGEALPPLGFAATLPVSSVAPKSPRSG